MSTEGPPQPPFYCPACGMKHRADLRALQGRSGAVAKVTCARCEVEMALRIGADGLPKCEANEPIGAAMSQPDAPKPGLLVPLAAAAVLAAVVSFAVTSALKPAAAEPQEDPRIAALQETVKTLQADLAKARGEATAAKDAAETAAGALTQRVERAEKTVAGLGESVSGIEAQASQVNKTFVKLQADYGELNGRIEANYVKLRGVDKRLKKVEGN